MKEEGVPKVDTFFFDHVHSNYRALIIYANQ
jgi:hypothetical protein